MNQFIDLTLLDETASPDKLESLKCIGVKEKVAGFCVYPMHLDAIQNNDAISRVTVLDFPFGNADISEVLAEIQNLYDKKLCDEIDFVFSYQTYISGDKQSAVNKIEQCINKSRILGLKSKIILETGAFEDTNLLYKACIDIVQLKPDFIKSSTGKNNIPGITPKSAQIILEAIKYVGSDVGIKFSGGIRDALTARKYIELTEFTLNTKVNPHWFRLGCSIIPI